LSLVTIARSLISNFQPHLVGSIFREWDFKFAKIKRITPFLNPVRGYK